MPELKALADHNAELTQEQTGPDGFPAKITATTQEVDELHKELAGLRVRFERVKERIEAAGMTDAVGLLLQKQQAELPDLRTHRQRLRARQSEASHVRAKLIELEDQRLELADLDKQVRKVMDTVDPNLLPYRRDEIENALRRPAQGAAGIFAVADRRGLQVPGRARLQPEHHRTRPCRRDRQVQELHQRANLVGAQAPTISSVDFRRAYDGVLKLADRRQWRAALADLATDARQNPAIYVAAAILLVPLFFAQRRLAGGFTRSTSKRRRPMPRISGRRCMCWS